MQRFTEIQVWQRSHALSLDVYRISTEFPKHEQFGLTSQLRRAMVSVPTNIAEGSKRKSNLEYARFLNIAESSLAEAEYLCMLARDLEYFSTAASDQVLAEISEIARMLHGLRVKVEKG